MSNQWLYEEYNTLNKIVGFDDIPYDINSSLAIPLRFYQENAVKRFIYYFEKSKSKSSNHILFEMATGSGKTLTMASLILYLYKKGYKNFLFFVNSTTILEKTKINFIDSSSTKHLFKTIELDNQRVEIKAINNLDESSPYNAINILFTTIQGLHSQLKAEKENALSIDEIKHTKLVLLADEAHHLSASTKKGKELELENDWESTVYDLLNANPENILLEFTATAETFKKEIQDKYQDKLIYKYSLQEFCNDGFSKKIGMIVNRQDNKDRILLALIINIFREDLLSSKGIPLKPVILFKSETISASKKNHETFIKKIDNLKEEDIIQCLENAKHNKENTILITYMLNFFAEQSIKPSYILVKIKSNFKQEYILNVNEEKEKGEYQVLLNSLEDYNNRIRAIFAVNKLNEGWDVLNLFDIVKLYKTKSNGNTTQEAQLIGRGARYYPFYINKEQEEDKYKRKYDKEDNPLNALEMLHYHTMDESKFINELSKKIEEQGLLLETNIKEVKINLKEEFKETDFYKKGILFVNKKLPFKDYVKINKSNQTNLFENNIINLPAQEDLSVEYKIIKLLKEADLDAGQKETYYYNKCKSIEEIGFNLFYKAISKNNFFSFDNIKAIGINSIEELYNYYKKTSITFLVDDENTCLNGKDIIQGLLQFLDKLKKNLHITEYVGTDFNEKKLIREVFKEKTIIIPRDSKLVDGSYSNYFMQNNFTGTSEEVELIKDIDAYFREKDNYKEAYLLRNEKHFKIYNFKDGRGFEPDFVFFLKNKNDELLNYQIFMEPKGEHLQEFDRWKETFLKSLKEKYQDSFLIDGSRKQRIIGLPFYNKRTKAVFLENLKKEIK